MKKIFMLLVCGTVVGACSPATDITASWKNPDFMSTSLRKIVVTALASDEAARSTLENDLSIALEEEGYAVLRGQNLLSPDDTTGSVSEREALLEKIGSNNADAILTVSIINENTENRFVPGKYDYAPIQQFEYYSGFSRYLGNRQPTVNTPGYYEEDNVYFLEINLYDARSEDLIWSAQSQSYSPGDMTAVSRDFAAVVLKKMGQDGILQRD